MRPITPVEIHLLRSRQGGALARERKRRASKPKLFRISKDRRQHLVGVVARLLERGEPTKFALEAPCRHGLRSALCLQGWPWAPADAIAADIVAAALRRIGAVRPTWREGQLWYTAEGATAIGRTRCIWCHRPLPENHSKYCSTRCKTSYYDYIAMNDDRAAYNAAMRVYRAAIRDRQNGNTAPPA